MSEVATYMKVGTTSIILAMIEDDELGDEWDDRWEDLTPEERADLEAEWAAEFAARTPEEQAEVIAEDTEEAAELIEVLDLEGEGAQVELPPAQLKFIHLSNTAALLPASIKLGAMAANATPAVAGAGIAGSGSIRKV